MGHTHLGKDKLFFFKIRPPPSQKKAQYICFLSQSYEICWAATIYMRLQKSFEGFTKFNLIFKRTFKLNFMFFVKYIGFKMLFWETKYHVRSSICILNNIVKRKFIMALSVKKTPSNVAWWDWLTGCETSVGGHGATSGLRPSFLRSRRNPHRVC